MTALLLGEYRKFVTTRMWWILAAVMGGYMLMIAAVMAAAFGEAGAALSVGGAATAGQDATLAMDDVSMAQSVYSLGVSMGYVFPALVGALSITGEFRYRTITPTFLAEPNRTKVLGAKLAAAVPIGLVFGLVGTTACVVGGAATLAITGHATGLGEATIWRNLALTVASLTLWCVVGVGFGSVLTNQVAAIVVLLSFTQFVEPILRVALAVWEPTRGVAKFLPGAAGDALAGGSLYSESGLTEVLTPWQGAVVLLAYALGLAAVGRLTRLRADVG